MTVFGSHQPPLSAAYIAGGRISGWRGVKGRLEAYPTPKPDFLPSSFSLVAQRPAEGVGMK